MILKRGVNILSIESIVNALPPLFTHISDIPIALKPNALPYPFTLLDEWCESHIIDSSIRSRVIELVQSMDSIDSSNDSNVKHTNSCLSVNSPMELRESVIRHDLYQLVVRMKDGVLVEAGVCLFLCNACLCYM